MRLHRLVLYGYLFLVLMVATPSFSQESRGSIVGRVTDSSDAVVVGVAVSATSETTGVVTPAKSNEQGNYEIRFLPPGQYKVSASMQGFKTWIQKNIELRVNDRIGL
ncbi:MAG: carboxypeptidase-like regulatory domain-containing protein, partial [Bryobacteraceae bacterium]